MLNGAVKYIKLRLLISYPAILDLSGKTDFNKIRIAFDNAFQLA